MDNAFFKKNHPYFSEEEIELCKKLKLSGVSYMMVKETITREYLKQGTLERESILSMFSLDKFIVNSVINHLNEAAEIVCKG